MVNGEFYNASQLLDANLMAGRDSNPALYFEDRCYTYGELMELVCRTGNFLRAHGVAAGSRVLLVLDDTPMFPAVFFGAIRLGAVPVPVNPRLRAEDLRYIAEDCGADLLVAEPAYEAVAAGAVHGTARPPRVINTARVECSLADCSESLALAPTTCDDMAFIQYSSGSTGRPKGIVHLQHDMLYSAETYARHVLRIQPDDKVFARLLFHGYGLGAALVFPFWAGASAVLTIAPPTPANLLAVMNKHRPSLFFSVPTIYNALLADPAWEAADLTGLRLCVSAAEPLPPAIWERWLARFGHSILDGIGSTELFHIFCSNVEGEVRPGSSGKPVPGYELRVLADDGTPVSTGETGNLWVKGDSASPFYWRQPEKTTKTMVGDWTLTGDLYRADSDGFYWYQGRADDMLKVGGEWVSPVRIENALIEHPEVQEAAVVGEHTTGILRIRAYLVARNGVKPPERELQEWCKHRLQRYEYPHFITFVPDLPKTASGKIQRFRLRIQETNNAL